MSEKEKSYQHTIQFGDHIEYVPDEIPILPVRNMVAFPLIGIPLAVGIKRSVELIEEAVKGNRLIGLVAGKDPNNKEPGPGQLHEVGTIVRIQHVIRSDDGTLQVIVQGLERFRVLFWLSDTPFLRARIVPSPDTVEEDVEIEAMIRTLRELAKEVVTLSPNLPKEAGDFLGEVKDPRFLVYVVAANSGLDVDQGQALIEENSIKEKMRMLLAHLSREKEVLTIGKKIQSEAKETIDKAQREFYLRQQLKAIQKELGEAGEDRPEADEYADRIESSDLPEEAKKEAIRELKRLTGMSPQSPEFSVIKTYLDWLLELPWKTASEDLGDIVRARLSLIHI